jgi:predicted RNase H-like HicB family nuclease
MGNHNLLRGNMQLKIEIEIEDDGRYLTEALGLPGVMAYGLTRQEAVRRVLCASLRIN